MPKQPNIIFIMADDMGYGDVGCYNPDSKIPTPYLDQLAQEGRKFTDAHAPSAMCTPTRYGVITGRYCWRTYLKTGVLNGYGRRLIEQDRLTVASLLQQQGYKTACIGKWHLGMDMKLQEQEAKPTSHRSINPELYPIDWEAPITNGPNSVGFDYFFGISASLDMPPYVYLENDRFTQTPTKMTNEGGRYGWTAEGFRSCDVLPDCTAKAIEFIEQSVAQTPEQPFFLYFPLNAPHTPIAPSPEFQGKSEAGEYGDFVCQVDDTVGQIMATLKKHNLEEDTLLIFTSDNGPERLAYQVALAYQHYSSGHLRGVKRDLWEGGHRVPFIAKWTGQIPANTTCDELICLTDFMSTAAELVGVELPSDAGEDSLNILPLLKGETLAEPIRTTCVLHSGKGFTLAFRNREWSYIALPSGDRNQTEPDWLKNRRNYQPHDQRLELFNLNDDPQERHNLAAERPEVLAECQELLAAEQN